MQQSNSKVCNKMGKLKFSLDLPLYCNVYNKPKEYKG